MIQKASVVQKVGKIVALGASTGAALVTVVSALYSYGVIGKAESHNSIGNIGAAWVGVRPFIDTAFAIGDTTHYAATIADKNGSILVGARPTWTTGDSNVAVVRADGSVIARGPGTTTVSVVVGALVANAKVLVRPRVASVTVSGGGADSVVVVAEGGEIALTARAYDSRGHLVSGRDVVWASDDSSVATLSASGVLTANAAGRTSIMASIDGATGRWGITVITTASALTAVAGTAQRALAGTPLAQPVVVRATSRRGTPASGQRVTFKLADGQGTVEPRTAVTDADGRARTTWTLGDYPGRQTLLASVEQLDSTLAIVAESDPVAANTRVTALVEQLRGRAGEVLSDSVAIRVTDSTGRALADIPVRWTVDDGGSVDALAARTDSMGVMRAQWTLAKRTGAQSLRAHVGAASGARGIAPVVIRATALAGAPTALVIVSGDAQRGAAGAALLKPIVVRVEDANGSGVAGMVVKLAPSNGMVADSALTTNEQGLVKVRWTMGRSAGTHALALRVDGVTKPAKVGARATPAAPANLSFDDAPEPVSPRKSKAKSRYLYAVVTDVYGNVVPDARMLFATKSGSVTPTRAVSDARGRTALTWTPGARPGEQTLTGAVRSTDVTGRYTTMIAGPAHESVHRATSSRQIPVRKGSR
ncbi:MAG: Ig-like domain-containing protein [Gemmatimonadaceae bacterium]|nr:Ig-like domain-containing protein [Gemmatimonadaceae bacterium]